MAVDRDRVQAFASLLQELRHLHQITGEMVEDSEIWCQYRCADGWVDRARQVLTAIVCDALVVTESEGEPLHPGILCPDCKGFGSVNWQTCHSCEGNGLRR